MTFFGSLVILIALVLFWREWGEARLNRLAKASLRRRALGAGLLAVLGTIMIVFDQLTPSSPHVHALLVVLMLVLTIILIGLAFADAIRSLRSAADPDHSSRDRPD